MPDSESQLPPSNTLVAGKYQLLGMIGRGGMGSVWEGKHVSLGTRVAIKFIEKEYAESEEARSRFDNEARAAATIQSKHAIQIYDHGVTEDGKPYIVMEMLEGEPLDKRLDRLGRMPLQETARILSQVSRALYRAHERGIVHRDLKPENIFLVRTPDDDEEVAKVLDFGIAKIRGPSGQSLSNSTKTGAVLGTPYYMSPEQARGLRNIDHRTDLWSLGVIVFKCVTGVLPFEGESLGDLLVKICTTPVPVPSQVLPGLSPAFDAWFGRALDREPTKRFANAQEMADALAYACGISVKRPPPFTPPPGEPLESARTVPSRPPPNYGASGPAYGSNPGQPYSDSQNRHSAQSGFPPTRGPNATSTPLTASSPQISKQGSNGPLIVGIALAMGIIGVLATLLFLRPKSTPSSVGGAPSNVSVLGAGAGAARNPPPPLVVAPPVPVASDSAVGAATASGKIPGPPPKVHGKPTPPLVVAKPPPGVTISAPPATPVAPTGKPVDLPPGF